MIKRIRYKDGDLILNEDGTLTAIGDNAHKAMFRINKIRRDKLAAKGYELLSTDDKEEAIVAALAWIFDGVNACKEKRQNGGF